MTFAAPVELLLVAVLWPLLGACLLVIPTMRTVALQLAPWSALPALLVSLLVGADEMRLHLTGVMLGSELGLDEAGRVFLLFTALLWLVAGVFARGYLLHPDQRGRFYGFFQLAMAGNYVLVISFDVFSFYLGFAVMSFASYGLVVFARSSAALRAGRVYMVMVVAGELMLFVAMLVAVHTTGSTSFDAIRAGLVEAESRNIIIALALGGFGIKAGVFGLHVWLPLAHPVAPTPASAVLSGAMIKAGLLGWLRLLPLGESALSGWGIGFLILGFVTTFYAVAVGLSQRDAKTVLAYSSVSQMGVMTAAIGMGLLAPHVWAALLPAVVFYALHHGLSKGALFLGMGLADKHYRMRGWVWVAMFLPALALAGAPWTSGMLAKSLLKLHLLEAPEPWLSWLPVLMSISSLATALLMSRLLYLVRPVAWVVPAPQTRWMVWPWLVSLACVAFMPWFLTPSLAVQDGVNIMGSLWPVISSVIVTAIVLHWGVLKAPCSLPPGDLLVPVERLLERAHRVMRYLVIRSGERHEQSGFRVLLAGLTNTVATGLRVGENGLIRWRVAGLLVVLLILAVGLMASPVLTGRG